MKTGLMRHKIAIVAAALTAAIACSVTHAQVKKGKARLLETKYLMRGVVKPHCGKVKDLLESAPANDKAWDELSMHAALLNEASFSLMDDGRCPDGVWADAASKKLRQGSADVFAAAQAKDYAAAKKAFGDLTSSCKSCHDKHKEKN